MNTNANDARNETKFKAIKDVTPNCIGDRLRYLRKAAGLTQMELALVLLEKHGISLSNSDISKYEAEKANPSIDTLMCLCEIFKTSSDYILFGEELSAPVMPAALEDSILALAEQIKACRKSK